MSKYRAHAATPEQLRRRLELRSSAAAEPHVNSARRGERRQRTRADARRAAIKDFS